MICEHCGYVWEERVPDPQAVPLLSTMKAPPEAVGRQEDAVPAFRIRMDDPETCGIGQVS